MRSKRVHVTVQLALAIALLIALTRTWASFTLEQGAAAVASVVVTGQDGVSALLPIAIALLATAVTLAIAGKALRLILGILTTAMGAWVAASTWSVARGDTGALLKLGSKTLQDATGLAPNDHSDLIESISHTPWPLITCLIGVVIAGVSIVTMIVGWSWARGGGRYETARRNRQVTTPGDRIFEWDALSGGDDPSDVDSDGTASEGGSTNPSGNR